MNWRALSRRLLPYMIAATGAFLAAYLIVAFFVFPAGIVPNEEQVPNVIGQSYEQAERTLAARGFRAERGESRFNPAAPRETVLDQDPPPTSLEVKGTSVSLVVSQGQELVTVPTLTGMTREEALRALDEARLDAGEITRTASELPRGQVLETTPAAGTRVTVPATVNLVVSAGPAAVQVPDLVGRSYQQARIMLEQLGLRVGVVTSVPSPYETPNTVVSHSPSAGETVPSGVGVSLRIASSGPGVRP